ncbi:protein kinase domain-containing protein [Oceaniferula spumae]
MAQPQIDGYEILGLVGEGACGSIYIAREANDANPGTWYAVRVFNALAVNRPLIENITGRLTNGSYPDGVVPIEWKQSQQGSNCMIMPMLADVDEEQGTIAPRSLQETIADYPKENAWDTIEKIANALASMHGRRIPHGNLKPGNVFFETNGDVLLTDFAMGHMPGVGMLPFTDALLYAPPEQLRDPEGYLSGKGYGWDTYAFAVLAFRMLTGKFPRCEATFKKVAPGPGEHHVTGIQADVIKLAERLEHRELENWPEEAHDDRERKRREVIQLCLSLNPEDRLTDLNEVLQAWRDIDEEARVAGEKANLRKKVNVSRFGMVSAMLLAGAGATGCVILSGMLNFEKSSRKNDVAALDQRIEELIQERDQAAKSEAEAIAHGKDAANRENKLRDQLLALGVTNDRLLAWMLRDKNTDLPELRKTGPDKTAAEAMERELRHFLKLTEGEDQFQPIRARIILQLSELEIHQQKPSEADTLLDKAIPALQKSGVEEPDQSYRIARARLICLIQALDQNNKPLASALLPKARTAIKNLKSADPTETQRINATMEIIDGRLVEATDPAKALEHFLSAIKNLEGIHKTLPDNIEIRSDLARNILHSSALAESLDRVDDAVRLRGEAANHLRWLLDKNPQFEFAKVKLAEIEIMAAEADMLAGLDSAGERKLAKAEELLEGLDPTDTSPTGCSMQIAVTKGLRAVLLRDRGQTGAAAKNLDVAIAITDKIVAANPKASEPLYRLAGFQWQRSSLAGDAGDSDTELKLGTQAAEMMQQLLEDGAGKRDNELRRSLAYLYGNLGHTASARGKKKDAVSFYNNASKMWQSLIDKNGARNEFTEGLKWSKERAREVAR